MGSRENAGILLTCISLTDLAAWIQFYIIRIDHIKLYYFFLPTAVGAVFGIILIFTRHYYQKSKQADHFEAAAKTDFLTGTLSRYAFYAHINDEIERSRRKGRAFCMAMLDIDDFKQINDVYGHQTGDEILIGFCELVQSRLRTMDHFNRWGGEEFMILLPETTLAEALLIAERIRKEVSEKDFGLDEPMTVSIGLTQNRKNDNIESLVGRIDHAMYDAKRLGKNRVETG
ncbi:GGDEF domain-containing protein [Hydrogenimonas sp.]